MTIENNNGGGYAATASVRGVPRRLGAAPPASRVATRSLRDGLRPPLTPEPLRLLDSPKTPDRPKPAACPPPTRGTPRRAACHKIKSLRFEGIAAGDGMGWIRMRRAIGGQRCGALCEDGSVRMEACDAGE